MSVRPGLRCFERRCVHLRGGTSTPDPEGYGEPIQLPKCVAYLEGIPEDIAWGEDLHLVVRDDQDNAIVYEREVES